MNAATLFVLIPTSSCYWTSVVPPVIARVKYQSLPLPLSPQPVVAKKREGGDTRGGRRNQEGSAIPVKRSKGTGIGNHGEEDHQIVYPVMMNVIDLHTPSGERKSINHLKRPLKRSIRKRKNHIGECVG